MQYFTNRIFVSNYKNIELLQNIIDRFSNEDVTENTDIDYTIVYNIELHFKNSYRIDCFSNRPIHKILDRLLKSEFGYNFEYYYWSRTDKTCGYYNDSGDRYHHEIPLINSSYEQVIPPIFDTIFDLKKELSII